jgi:hypothetical protein
MAFLLAAALTAFWLAKAVRPGKYRAVVDVFQVMNHVALTEGIAKQATFAGQQVAFVANLGRWCVASDACHQARSAAMRMVTIVMQESNALLVTSVALMVTHVVGLRHLRLAQQ